MGLMHKVEILWEDLLDAFSSGQGDRVYFLDRITGEIFFVTSSMQDDEFWLHMEKHHERFIEIPQFDFSNERKIFTDFLAVIEDPELKHLLANYSSGRKPYGKTEDILEFFPHELAKLTEMRDNFVTNRMKIWLEENNLFTSEATEQLSLQL